MGVLLHGKYGLQQNRREWGPQTWKDMTNKRISRHRISSAKTVTKRKVTVCKNQKKHTILLQLVRNIIDLTEVFHLTRL